MFSHLPHFFLRGFPRDVVVRVWEEEVAGSDFKLTSALDITLSC